MNFQAFLCKVYLCSSLLKNCLPKMKYGCFLSQKWQGLALRAGARALLSSWALELNIIYMIHRGVPGFGYGGGGTSAETLIWGGGGFPSAGKQFLRFFCGKNLGSDLGGGIPPPLGSPLMIQDPNIRHALLSG